jgi:hypothetical protein
VQLLLRELSVRAPWLVRALCVGRLGLLYTLERTKLCAPENIACPLPHHPSVRTTRSYHPESDLARYRLGHILKRPSMPSKADAKEWADTFVKPNTTEDDKVALMAGLLNEKYTIDNKYGEVLLATDDKVLHET